MNNNIYLNFASNYDYGNFGDLLSRYIVEQISHKTVIKYSHQTDHVKYLNAIGSIINRKELCSYCIIWGSGFLSPSKSWKLYFDKLKYFLLNHKIDRPKILAVRGLKTYTELKNNGFECPKIFGDPALLMPMYYNPSVSKKYKLGIILHYSHEKIIKKFINNDILFIPIERKYDEITQFIDEILSCECILSSSLHGLILSNAYNVPCVRLKIMNHSIHCNPCREDFKFDDYISGINYYKGQKPAYDFSIVNLSLQDLNNPEYLLSNCSKAATKPLFKINTEGLLQTFPYKLGDNK